MALFIKQNEPQTQLEQKIAADLDKRLRDRDNSATDIPPPQPTLLDDTEVASGSGFVWIVAAVLVVVVILYLVLR